MSACETIQDSPDALADWTPIQTPDGLWCVWSERTQLPIKLGTKQAHLLPDVSKALGSIDRAHDAFRAANADPDRWDRLLASLPPATARFLASKVGEPVARREVAPLRQMPASSVSNPYVVGDQLPKQGETVKAAPAPPAVTYGRHYKTASGHRRNRANTPRYDDKIKALHAEGLHTGAIAAQLRCKEQTVRNAYARLEITGHRKPTESYKPRISPPHPQDAQIKALHSEGLHNAEIARRCALGARVVDGRVKALGLVRHKAWQPKAAPPAPPVPPTPAADGETCARRRPYSRRWMDQCAAAQRASEVTAAQAMAALASERTHRAAAIKLGVTTYRLRQLLQDRPSALAVRRAKAARRDELARIAILAVKAAGATLREVYDLRCASRATIKAIYNGEAT